MENNIVKLTGEIVTEFQYSHEVYGERFYMIDVVGRRTSGYEDIIPVLFSERLIDTRQSYVGKYISVDGQFRSFNRHEDSKNKLILSVFVREYSLIDELKDGGNNCIELCGFICKPPTYRKTPLGREIGDLLVAVNRSYGKTDYIPCICWGRNARFASNLTVGSRIGVEGRIQSREYVKKISETETETRIAYEVSISKIEVANDEKESN